MRKAPRKRIDWAAVHATLAAHAAPAAAAMDEARADRLLTERTRALAAGKPIVTKATERMLVMRAGAERYALSLAAVREVVEVERMAALPGARSTVMGIVHWRGEFALVFDLAAIVGAERTATPRRAVVLAGTDPPTAVAVESVEEIVAIEVSALGPGGQLSPRRASLFRGVAADALLVLDDTALVGCLRNEIRGGNAAAA